jgi:hypothetical protein
VTEAQPAIEAELHDRLRRQIAVWRRDLLALDRRQRLLHFKHTRTASLEIVAPVGDELLALVQAGGVPLAAPDDDGDDTLPPGGSGSRGLLVGNKRPAELPASLRRLDQQSQQVYADRGIWTLYLGLGMVQWVDAGDGSTIVSPLILVPVRLDRAGMQQPYKLSRTEDEIVLNPALRLKLEQDFDVTFADVDEYAVDVERVLAGASNAITGRAGWDVLERAVLTTFSFHKEAIYRDLLDHEQIVLGHPIVQLVALGPDAPTTDQYGFEPVPDEALDTVVAPEELRSILDADGSQRKCILAARAGRSFVMDGPPGTGKSQTIANIIVELISTGRTVLFVSEKAAALDVVRKRLAAAGLGEFLLELHSHAATRKQVVQELDRALTSSIRSRHAFTATDEAALRSARERLSAYARAVNEVRPGTGRSLHDVLGRLATLHELDDLPAPEGCDWESLTAVRANEIRAHGDQLARSWRPVLAGADFPWRDLASVDVEPSGLRRLGRGARAASEAARRLVERVHAVDGDLGVAFPVTEREARRRLELLRLIGDWPASAPRSWLSRADVQPVHGRIEILRSATAAHLTCVRELERTAGPQWGRLDGDLAVALVSSSKAQQGWCPDGTTSAAVLAELVQFLETSPGRLVPVAEDAQRLAATLGVSVDGISASRAATLAELASLGTRPARPESSWLNPGLQTALDESVRVLGELVNVVRQREESLGEVFTADALGLDLRALHTRFRDTHRGLHKLSGQARADKKALRTVTVAGKVDKGVLARLEEAVAWQEAERALSLNEADHAPILGSYYRRTATDFSRVAAAIETAHTAVRLAGEDLNASALSQHLALGGSPDPALHVVGERLWRSVREWRVELSEHLGSTVAGVVESMPMADAAAWCAGQADVLRPVDEAVQHAAEIVGRLVTIKEARELLDLAAQASAAAAALYDSYDEDRDLIGPGYVGSDTDWSTVDDAVAWADRVRAATAGAVAPAVADALATPTLRADDLAPLLDAWESTRAALTREFDPHRAHELTAELDDDLAGAVKLTAEMADVAGVDIDEWCVYVRAREWLTSAGCGPVVDELVHRRAERAVVADGVERTALQAWVDATVRADTRLGEYRAKDRDALVSQFQDLDSRLVAEAHAAVAAACSARRPRALTSRAAQTIRREAQKKTRHKPIRELLTEAGGLSQELKPCFMMSPLSVSQYLPADLRFDIVIFDEASQVLPSDAINCIYRGDQLIVAGDQKQLPPTSFFARAVEDDPGEEEGDLDTFQSVLDLCKAAGAFPSLPLRWHYRSQHESLITYSNYRFYDGGLHTFPGAAYDTEDLGVASYVVDGVYRRGGARDNPIEAEAVVDRIVYHRRHHPDLSLGVVTFSSAQEDAVLAAVERRSTHEPVLAGLLDEHDRLDGFFVKALENVQGDERDIIIFTIGYGPDENGKLTLNFGPLNRDGGWRRLNVAITRARRRVEVVSSFRPGAVGDTNSEGVRHLRGYLDFADRGIRALALDVEGSQGDAESPFEEDVLRVIRSWGYDAVPQVGAAGYRIDIGVKHPSNPGEYALAVECDGAAYHSAKAARDRDRLREGVLRGLGWEVHRIWGLSWIRDRTGQKQRLRAAIEAAITTDGQRPAPPRAPSRESTLIVEELDFDAPPPWAVPYRVGGGRIETSPYEPHTPEARPLLRAYFQRVLAVEAPVHEDVLLRRLREDWRISRIGHRIRENALAALSVVTFDGARATRDGHGFWRLSGSRPQVVRVPVDVSTARSVAYVPSEELDGAMLNVVRDAGSAERDQLFTAVARIFGWGRHGTDVNAALGAALSRLTAEDLLSQPSFSEVRLSTTRTL